jgi:hypothetical protein
VILEVYELIIELLYVFHSGFLDLHCLLDQVEGIGSLKDWLSHAKSSGHSDERLLWPLMMEEDPLLLAEVQWLKNMLCHPWDRLSRYVKTELHPDKPMI